MFRWLIARAASISAGRELKRFFSATKNLQSVQDAMFKRQLQINAGSDFARDYNLRHVDTYSDFIARVPILRYEDLKPYIEKMKEGDASALLHPAESLIMFALTSGTTGEPKYIPVTKRSVADYRRGWNIFGLKAILDHPNSFMKKIVQVTSNPREHRTSSGIWAGAITGLLAQMQKFIVRRHYVTPLNIAEITDPQSKMYTVARLALPTDIGFISTANPSTTLRFAQAVESFGEQLVRDLHDGTISPPAPLPQSVLKSLHFKPNHKRAKELTKILNSKGKLYPKDCWDIGFIANWMGGTLKLYLQRFPEYFGTVPVRDIGLLASEGRFSIPVEDGTAAGILEITSNFFEFIPESERDKKNPAVLRASEVKTGEKYFLLFSNATGLCRYDIGDMVRVVDFYNQTPRIEFLNKGSHISSMTGEKLTERQVVEAVGEISGLLKRHIESFRVHPQWDDPPYYVLALEESVAGERQDFIAESFDKILCRLNIEYESKRSSNRLACPRIERVENGYFRRDDLNRLASTGRSEQYKRKFLITTIKK